MHWGEEGFIQVLVGKAKGKIPLIRLRCRWEDNIKWILERQNEVV
jgi:hypothetical protein